MTSDAAGTRVKSNLVSLRDVTAGDNVSVTVKRVLGVR